MQIGPWDTFLFIIPLKTITAVHKLGEHVGAAIDMAWQSASSKRISGFLFLIVTFFARKQVLNQVLYNLSTWCIEIML